METAQGPKLSVYMITYNNERTVERALKSVAWADEIVVVDSFSTDKSMEICRRFTEKVIQRKWPGHQEQYQYAADLTTHPWIMFVDADEEVPPELAEEIQREIREGARGLDGFIVYRRTYYLGRWIRHGGWYPDREIRIYRRNQGRWEGGLHAKVVVTGRIRPLKNYYFHYNYLNISEQIQTIDRYSRIAVEDMVKINKPFWFLNLVFNPPLRFFKDYFLKRGFLDGMPGFVIAISTSYYVFIKHAKLWEHYFVSIRKDMREGIKNGRSA